MRKFVLALVAASSVVGLATPAAAQYYPQRGYGGNGGYGYNQSYVDVGDLHRRIRNVLNSIDGVRPDQRQYLYSQAINLDRQLRYATRNGLSPWEAEQFNQRIAQLERRQLAGAMNRGGRYGGYNDRYYDGRRDHRDNDRDHWDNDDD